MSKVVTPARLASAVGVCTGLAAAATSLAGVFTVGSSVGNAVVAGAGILTTGATVFKFLEGQSNFEQAVIHANAAQGNVVPLSAANSGPECHAGSDFTFSDPPEPDATEPVTFVADPAVDAELNAPSAGLNTAVLPGEEPLVDAPEPQRQVQQLVAAQAPEASA